jgi:spore maturation protein CgeB
VAYFQTIEECLGKIDYYLKNEQERRETSEKGYEYARKYLTTQQRLKELIILYENKESLCKQ